MSNNRTTHGGKGDEPRNLGPQFQTNYGNIDGFANNRIYHDFSDHWYVRIKGDEDLGPFTTKAMALTAAEAAIKEGK